MTGALVLLSGGMDSTTLLAHTRAQHHDRVATLSVNYGQRHLVELAAARDVARYYGVTHEVLDLTELGKLLTGSALTDPTVPVPEGHYAEQSMRATVVPNRNAIMLMAAVGVASARGLNTVLTAVHAGDHFIYPDCRPEFIAAASHAARLGTASFGDVSIEAPFVHMTKTEVAAVGAKLTAPLHLSWSCYQGGEVHCGRCGTCVERQEAMAGAGISDPTPYADADYWKQSVSAGPQ